MYKHGVSASRFVFKKWERKCANKVYGGILRACRLRLWLVMKSWFDNFGWNWPVGFSRTPGQFSQKCQKFCDWMDRCAPERVLNPIKAVEAFVLADTFQTQYRKGEFGELALEWSSGGPFWLRTWVISPHSVTPSHSHGTEVPALLEKHSLTVNGKKSMLLISRPWSPRTVGFCDLAGTCLQKPNYLGARFQVSVSEYIPRRVILRRTGGINLHF